MLYKQKAQVYYALSGMPYKPGKVHCVDVPCKVGMVLV